MPEEVEEAVELEQDEVKHLTEGQEEGEGEENPVQKCPSFDQSPLYTSASASSSESDVVCPECKLPELKDGENTQWVLCDNLSCSNWYHVTCTDIDPLDYNILSSATWLSGSDNGTLLYTFIQVSTLSVQ